jgi:transglutaminase-like putative cysteine protease
VVGKSGLSEKMQVGAIAKLALDDSVAMRIKFDGTPPRQSEMYLRGPALSSFDGREWRPARPDFSSRFSVTASLVVSGTPTSYQVTLQPTQRPWLFVLDAAIDRPVLAGFQSNMQADLQWTLNKPVTELVRYKAQSYTRFKHGPEKSVVGLREFVELPTGFNPRTLADAVSIRNQPQFANAGSAVLVDYVMDRLRRGGYTYTLEPGLYGPNTADDFWYERKEGFCEHIASSFVILMRALDVPARIVTGYQGGELNSVDGFWTIRQSDAHAWAEVWYEDRGWVRVDPTSAVAPGRTGASQRLSAPQGLVGQALGNLSPAFSQQLRAAWEAVNNSWNQWVLNYSQGKQLDLLKNVGFTSPSWEDLSYVLIGIIVVVSLLGAAWSLWERTQHDPWLRLLGKARKRLAKAGIESSPASTPRQLAAKLKASSGSQHADLQAWLMQLEAQRYANSAPSSQQLRQLGQQFKALGWPA